MRWSGPVSIALHVAALAWFALGRQVEPPAMAAPIEIALLPPASPPPPPPAPPEPIRMPELARPEPLAEPKPLELDEPPPELLAEEPEPPVALPKQRPKPLRKSEPPKPEIPPAPAAAPSPAPPAPQPPAQVASSAPAAAPPSYLAKLVAELERCKNYPRSAQRRREEGTALLRFTLARDGRVTDWRIERSSGHESLDGAVALMIRKADPLPPLPPEIAGDHLDLVVPVSFVLR
jgi:protein TonB